MKEPPEKRDPGEIKDEVKALYREGHREGGGILSRQRGEPMKSFITRRERWYTMLRGFDDTVKFSDELLGELTLLNAGISDLERKLILTVTGNKTPTEKVKDALILHRTPERVQSEQRRSRRRSLQT